MAQLRDAQTSEILAEGSPLEVAEIAAGFDPDDIIFDDVGAAFDPAAVLAADDRDIAGLEGAAADDEFDDDTRESIARSAAARRERRDAARSQIQATRQLLDQVRERRRRRRERERQG